MTQERHLGLTKRVTAALMLATVLGTNVSIKPAYAQQFVTSTQTIQAEFDESELKKGFIIPPTSPAPVVEEDESDVKVLKTYTVPMTAYTSAVEECDDTPFIAADGTRTYDGMVAANFLPFGTKIRIPDLFGDKVFTVHDRMNSRYGYRVDVWHETKSQAFKFGLKKAAKIEVIEMGDGKTAWNKKIAKTETVKMAAK